METPHLQRPYHTAELRLPQPVLCPRGIYDAFVQPLCQGRRKIVVGDPTDPKTMMGPLSLQRTAGTRQSAL